MPSTTAERPARVERTRAAGRARANARARASTQARARVRAQAYAYAWLIACAAPVPAHALAQEAVVAGSIPASAMAASAPPTSAAPPIAPPASSAASAPAAAPTADEVAIERAAAALRQDPLLNGHHKTHTLRWTGTDDEPDAPVDRSWLKWFAALARFLADTSRFLVYGLAIVAAALLLVSLRHFVQLRASKRRLKASAAVSHVRDLDVRPDSLPDDVGAAAWALWQAGQVKAALSLLYRAALSRLIHRHGVPIAASSTEGECLALAQGRIAQPAQRYLTQLVRAWEANTYGERSLSAAMGESLCTGFAIRLDAAPPAADDQDARPPARPDAEAVA